MTGLPASPRQAGTTHSMKRKLSLPQLAEELGNVSKACKIVGYHRGTFYELRRAFQRGGVAALVEEKRGPRTATASRRRSRPGSSPTAWSGPATAPIGSPTSCGYRGSPSAPRASAACGCATTWRRA